MAVPGWPIGMPLTPEDLHRIAARPLAPYDQNAQALWEDTREQDD
jgi:hypothetical protein